MSSRITAPQTRDVTKIDLKKELKLLYNPPAIEVVLLEVPDMAFLMVDGSGNPNTAQEYQDALHALYNVSYTLKFLIKYVTAELVTRVCEELKQKKDLHALSKLRFESFHEGLSVQIMHIGPYAAEKPTIEKLHAYIKNHGYEFNGKHHEIYLGDPRRAAPEKMKTVLRRPVKGVL